MNLALLQRFAPLMKLGSKKVGDITKEELRGVAYALTGDEAKLDGIMPFLEQLQAAAPLANPVDLLGTDAAQKLFAKLKDDATEMSNVTFCTCPYCSMNFEVTLS